MSPQDFTPTILVIFGISGNLAKRRLLPAIQKIAAAGMLPEKFRVLGISRQALQAEEIVGRLNHQRDYALLAKYLEIFPMDTSKETEYGRLDQRLLEIEKDFAAPTQRLFYLAIPPQVSNQVIELLGQSGLAQKSQTKLLLEKPFGVDLLSAQELINTTNRYFREEQLYRIDHYLAKEMAQNILVFRSGNSLFKQSWNKDFIEKIEIIVSEKIGIEGRADFYEQTGALRDVLQSHLLQLAALILMRLPTPQSWHSYSDEKLAALQQLQSPAANKIKAQAKRGQYIGYRQEVNNPRSQVETFIHLTLFSQDPNWQGVPVVLCSGKALATQETVIKIHFKKKRAEEGNQLAFRIRPKEEITLQLWTKKPGYERKLEQSQLRFTYQQEPDSLPDAYEQVLVDAINSDQRLFASSAEVLASWQILAPIQHAWQLSADDLLLYPPGSSVAAVLAQEQCSIAQAG